MKVYTTEFILPGLLGSLTVKKVDKILNQKVAEGWVLHSQSVIETKKGIGMVAVFENTND